MKTTTKQARGGPGRLEIIQNRIDSILKWTLRVDLVWWALILSAGIVVGIAS